MSGRTISHSKMMNVAAHTILVLLGSLAIIQAAEPPPVQINSDDVRLIRRFLENTEKGNVDNEALDNSEFRQKLLTYYQEGTNSISLKGKLAISTGFGRDKRYVEAIVLAKEYVAVYSNGLDGYSIGNCCFVHRASRCITEHCAEARFRDTG